MPALPPRVIRHLSVAALVCVVGVASAWVRGPKQDDAFAPVATLDAQGTDRLWLAPDRQTIEARARLATAVLDLAAGQAERAQTVFAEATSDSVLGGYALLHLGRAQLALGRHREAAFSAQQLLSTQPSGYLQESALWLAADIADGAGDMSGARRALEALTGAEPLAPASAHLRLARAAAAQSDRAAAMKAFRTVYYEFALSPEATEATDGMKTLLGWVPRPTRASYALDLGRAQRLFGARRYTDARALFDLLRPLSSGDDRQLIELRLAQSDFHLKKYAAARTALRTYVDRATTRQPEGQYYYLSTLRQLGRHAEYVALAKAFVDGNAADPLAEATLNDLATHYILQSEDAKAAQVFTEQYRRYPTGTFAGRAAWKAGWWAYRTGDYAECIRLFESAAVGMPRADYRPSWLYWAARAHLQLRHSAAALDGFAQVIADYRNSYYGREAAREVEAIEQARRPAGAGPVLPVRRASWPAIDPGPRPGNARLIEHLLAAGMFVEAVGELRRMQNESGSSPLIEATLAYAYRQQGSLRPAINTMRRAYPQFMGAGGEQLPTDILTTIFPVEYWDLIARYAADRKIDPFLLAALIAQESTFQADVRSAANAYGLMQILPSTGRRYAQTLGIRPFTTMRLTDPETNVKIGTAYLADLLRQFGHVAPALAAYNAGENRVERWLAERPGIDRDEFVDDIPFPETQNYVKRIVGTAQDYRVLYRGLLATDPPPPLK